MLVKSYIKLSLFFWNQESELLRCAGVVVAQMYIFNFSREDPYRSVAMIVESQSRVVVHHQQGIQPTTEEPSNLS